MPKRPEGRTDAEVLALSQGDLVDDSYFEMLRNDCPDFGDQLFTLDEAEEIFWRYYRASRGLDEKPDSDPAVVAHKGGRLSQAFCTKGHPMQAACVRANGKRDRRRCRAERARDLRSRRREVQPASA